MTRLVVDASVAIKWYVPEVHSEAAARILDALPGGVRLEVPDLFFPECGNILWKKVRVGEIGRAAAAQIAATLLGVPKTAHPTEPLLPSALDIALATGQTVYDSVYLALAALLECPLVTADERLRRGLAASQWEPLVRWVEDL